MSSCIFRVMCRSVRYFRVNKIAASVDTAAFVVFFMFGLTGHCEEWARYTAINHIRDIAARDGVVWCATDGGMVRWNLSDGSHEVFTGGMFDRAIFNEVEIDSDGNVWCGRKTNYWGIPGLLRYDGSELQEITETTLNDVASLAVTSDNVVWFGNRLWALMAYDGSKLTEYNSSESDYKGGNVDHLAIGSDDVVWAAAQELWSFDGETWTEYTEENSGLFSNDISGIAVDDRNRVWLSFGSSGGILQCFDGEEWTTFDSDSDFSGYLGGSEKIVFDDTGALWFTGFGGGVRHIDETGTTTYTVNDGLADNAVTCSAYDPERGVFFGTDGFGFSWFDGHSWTTFYDEHCLSDNYICDIAVDDNNVKWFATSCGVSSYDGIRWRNYPDSPLSRMSVISVATGSDNDVWFATSRDGIAKYDGEFWHLFTGGNGFPVERVTDIAVDIDDILWVTAKDGIYAYDGISWRRYTIDDGLNTNSAQSVVVDLENVKWFGMRSEYPMSFDGEEWIVHDEITDESLDGVSVIAVDMENVKWFSTDVFYSYDQGEWQENMPDLQVCGPATIAGDMNNVIWFGLSACNTGGAKMGGILSLDNGTWNYYGGLEGEQIWKIAVDHDNIKWIGTYYGLWSFDDGRTEVTSDNDRPGEIDFHGAFPNPFNGYTVLSYSLARADRVECSIYAITGQKVRTVIMENVQPGTHEMRWDGRSDEGALVSSGVYLVRVKTNRSERYGRVVFMK